MRVFNFVKDIAHIEIAERRAGMRNNTDHNEPESSGCSIHTGRDNGDAMRQEKVLAINSISSGGEAYKEEKEGCQAACEEKDSTQAAEEKKRAEANAEGRKSSKRNSKRTAETGS